MKTSVFLLFLSLSINLNAQLKYLKVNFGVSHYIRKSDGSGFNLGIAGIYSFNKHIGVEVNLNYFRTHFTWYVQDPYPGGLITKMRYKPEGEIFSFNPSLLLSTGKEKFDLYYRIGPLIGLGHETFNYEWSGDNVATSTSTFKSSGGFVYGLNQAIGFKSKINDRLFIFTEVACNFINYRATYFSYTHVDPNFYGASDAGKNREINDNPFSNIGGNAGVIFSLAK